MSEQKINNTFLKAHEQIDSLQKAFREGGKLEKAIAESGGDITVITQVTRALTEAANSIIAATTPQVLSEGVLDDQDDDGFMARSQLYFLAKDAIALHGMIDDRDDLEPWVHSKIVAASEGIDAVRRYTEYRAMTPEEPQLPAVVAPQDELPDDMGVEENQYSFEFNPRAGHMDQPSHPDNAAIMKNKSSAPKTSLRPKARSSAPKTSLRPQPRPATVSEAGGYYTQPVYDMIEKHGYEKVMHELLTSLHADAIKSFLQRAEFEESYSPGDENEEGMVSNCCGAPIMDVYQGHGRCSDCKEMASAEVEESVNEAEKRWKQTSMSPAEAEAEYGKDNVKVKKGALRNGDDMVEVFVEGMEFDEKRDSELKTVAQDVFKNALATAKKKSKK